MAVIETLSVDGPGRALGVDVVRPTDGAARTAIVLLHGGGLRAGSRAAMHARARALAALGFVAVVPEYRLLPEAVWPAPLDDALAAFEWTIAHASDLGIDPDRVVVQGHSAGAYLALLVGVLARPAAVACFYPTIGLHVQGRPADEQPGLTAFAQAQDGTIPSHLILGDDTDPQRVHAASPIHRIDATFPPTLILHGSADWLVREWAP